MTKRVRVILAYCILFIPVSMLLLTSCSKKPELTPTQVLDNQVTATREAIDKYVENDERSEKLLVLLDEVNDLLQEYNRGFEERVKEFREAFNDYDSSREQLDRLAGEINASTRKSRSEFIDLHFQMRDLTTKKEWKKIVKYEQDAIRAARSLNAE